MVNDVILSLLNRNTPMTLIILPQICTQRDFSYMKLERAWFHSTSIIKNFWKMFPLCSADTSPHFMIEILFICVHSVTSVWVWHCQLSWQVAHYQPRSRLLYLTTWYLFVNSVFVDKWQIYMNLSDEYPNYCIDKKISNISQMHTNTHLCYLLLVTMQSPTKLLWCSKQRAAIYLQTPPPEYVYNRSHWMTQKSRGMINCRSLCFYMAQKNRGKSKPLHN